MKSMDDAIIRRVGDTAGSVTVYVYEPGNGTRYVVQITDLRDFDIDEYRGAMTLLNMPRRGSCPLMGYAPFPSYIEEKTGVYPGDAEALHALLKHHFGR